MIRLLTPENHAVISLRRRVISFLHDCGCTDVLLEKIRAILIR